MPRRVAVDAGEEFLVPFRPSLDAVAAAGAVALLFVHNFWAMTDLWLLARVAEQFYAGSGPVWNAGERVWVYTSVAWQWLLIAARGASGGAVEPYLYVMVLHGLCLLAAVALVWRRWGKGRTLLLVALLLAGSNAIIDYSSGGLANGLGYVAVAGVWLLLTGGARLRWVALAFGLTLLVRYDLALLLGPAVAFVFWRSRDLDWRELLEAGCLAAGPVLLWTAFAWPYYGAPVPNGYEQRSADFFGGLWPHYWRAFLSFDLWGAGLLLAGTVAGFWRGGCAGRALAAGVLVYCVYVTVAFASQDGLVGRALSGPLFLSALLVAGWLHDWASSGRWSRWGTALCSVCFLLVLAPAFPPHHTPLFPGYSSWSGYAEPTVVDSYLDARYYSLRQSLPRASERDWRGAEPAWEDWLLGYDRPVYVDTEGAAWIVAYYLPLDVVVVEGFHRHFRHGDFEVDAPR